MTKVKHPKLVNPVEQLFDYVTYYHIFLFTLLFIGGHILSWHTLSFIFLSPPIDFYCDTTEILVGNTSISTDIKNHCPCIEPWWDVEVFTSTMQTKYDVYCETEWLIKLSNSLFCIGLLSGSFFLGYLSDNLMFLCKVPIGWHILSFIFLSPPTEFYRVVNNTKYLIVRGDYVDANDNITWDTSVFTKTMQSKFKLSYDSVWLVSLSVSFFNFGLLLGALILGVLSDKYGRLSMLTISSLILAIFGSLVTVMPTASTYILMRCIEGIGAGGAVVTSFVLCIEYCGVRHRETITALYHIPINLGHMTLAGLSYLLRDCDELQLAISLPTFLLVALRWLVMESPKWMMDNDDIDGAADIMQKFCRFNKVSCKSIKEELTTFHRHHEDKKQGKTKFWTIFRYKRLSITFGCMSIIFFVCGIGYYGVAQFIGKMSGNIHENVAISAVILLPGTIASVFLLKVFGRRPFLMGTSFLSGLFIIIVVFIPVHIHWLRVLFASLSNTFFFMSFIIVFLYGVELFPTPIRNSVLGVLSVLSRIGQIAAPLVNSLSEVTSGLIFGIMAILGGILCFPLPETKNTELPTSFQDTEAMPWSKIELEEDPDYNEAIVGTSRASQV